MTSNTARITTPLATGDSPAAGAWPWLSVSGLADHLAMADQGGSSPSATVLPVVVSIRARIPGWQRSLAAATAEATHQPPDITSLSSSTPRLPVRSDRRTSCRTSDSSAVHTTGGAWHARRPPSSALIGSRGMVGPLAGRSQQLKCCRRGFERPTGAGVTERRNATCTLHDLHQRRPKGPRW